MPTYRQKCKSCGHRFEVSIEISQFREPQPCPECGFPTTVRVMSASAHILKGGGWAKDGYSSKSGGKE